MSGKGRKFIHPSEARIDVELIIQSYSYMDEDGILWFNTKDNINYVYNPT